MDAIDYPIEHFEFLTAVAQELKQHSIQILKHEYHYQVFGSWYFTFKRGGKLHRLVFDGKENELRVERATGKPNPVSRYTSTFIEDWEEVASIRLADRSKPTVDQVIALIKESAH